MNSLTNDNDKNFLPVNELEKARGKYKYNYTRIPPIAMIDELPSEENFSTGWLRLLAKELKTIFVNMETYQSYHAGD